MISIIDYGVGNLFSLSASLNYLNIKNQITSNKETIEKSDKIILPGVGAFEDAMKKLQSTGLVNFLKQQTKTKKLLGICLGMQLLLEKSFEYGEHDGLSLIKGEVRTLSEDLPKSFKVPHMGWNKLKLKEDEPLFKYITNGDYVYFVHSYHAIKCNLNTIATTDYKISITAAISSGNVYGVQFHPEKSGDIGLKILKAFNEL
ncbi:MAG: imidazole glycerol phosphate synthase subunit HisH [Oscillospiraceae bacterium]|nr:imidazole glycerol phosphate synthase subunit HisH [Oscillospiraceae bacterium]